MLLVFTRTALIGLRTIQTHNLLNFSPLVSSKSQIADLVKKNGGFKVSAMAISSKCVSNLLWFFKGSLKNVLFHDSVSMLCRIGCLSAGRLQYRSSINF